MMPLGLVLLVAAVVVGAVPARRRRPRLSWRSAVHTVVPACVAVVLLAAVATAAFAQGAPPFTAYGGGLAAGATVEVFDGGRSCGTAPPADARGNWSLQFGTGAPCKPAQGDVLTFTVDGQPATSAHTETYQAGGAPVDVANGIALTVAAGRFDRPIVGVGVNTAVWLGGSVAQLSAAAAAAGAVSVTTFVNGQPMVLVPGAPSFVNARFTNDFAAGVPPDTIVLVTAGSAVSARPTPVAPPSPTPTPIATPAPFTIHGTAPVDASIEVFAHTSGSLTLDNRPCATSFADAQGQFAIQISGASACSPINGDTLTYAVNGNELSGGPYTQYATGGVASVNLVFTTFYAGEQPGTILGTVYDAAGNGVAGVMVTVAGQEVRTGVGGVFAVYVVPPGTYAITVEGFVVSKVFAGPVLQGTSVLVVAGQTSVLDVHVLSSTPSY